MLSEHNRNEEKKSAIKTGRDLLIFFAILGMVALIWWGGAQWIDNNINPATTVIDNFAARGQFGDKFGAINALFAGFAFAGIIFTIYLQNRELSQTKEMLKEQMKDSNKQRFDSTFFQLLKLQNDISTKLAETENEGYNSFRAFNSKLILQDHDYPAYTALRKIDDQRIRALRDSRLISNELKAYLDVADISNLEEALDRGIAAIDNYLDKSLEFQEKKFRNAYTVVAASYVDNYSHYFRNLYHILAFIKSSPLIESHERPGYAKIVRSQLSEQELLTLFYNSLTKIDLPGREQIELGFPKMGALLKHYDILQNLPKSSLIHPMFTDIFEKNYQGVEKYV